MPRRRKQSSFSPMRGELAQHEELGEVRVVERNRSRGIHGATVRPTTGDLSNAPGLGMQWVPLRELTPSAHQPARGGQSAAAPSGGIAVTQSQDSPDLQERNISLQKDATRGSVPNRSKQTTNKRRTTTMATAAKPRSRGGRKATEEKETTTKTRGRGKAAKAAEPEETNGNGRRSHEDILELVPEIVEKLRDGETMTAIRAEYGAGPVIRKALAEKGYNTKGEKIEVEDLSDLKGVKLAKALARLREDGKAWYYLELASDMSAGEIKDLLDENGFEELTSGRVSTAVEEEEEKPKAKRSGRKPKAAAEDEEEEAKPAARKRGRGRGRTRTANPSEDEE